MTIDHAYKPGSKKNRFTSLHATDYLKVPATLDKPAPACILSCRSASSLSSSIASSTELSAAALLSPHLESQLTAQAVEIRTLKQDLAILNKKCLRHIERLAAAEHAKAQIEHELEDLSRQLFERANEMVKKERRIRMETESRLEKLRKAFVGVQQELADEREQLAEIRDRFASLSLDQQVSDVPTQKLQIDKRALALFQDFLANASEVSLSQLHRLPFLKLCYDQDIEPCLRGFSHWSLRRIVDALLHRPCPIEPIPLTSVPGNEPLRKMASSEEGPSRWSLLRRHASSSISDQCYLCASLLTDQTYRCRLREQDQDWHMIDRACRDRLVAVCNFYAFVRHVRLGLYTPSSVTSLFQECLRLRLGMFWARSGLHLNPSFLSDYRLFASWPCDPASVG
ncbi:uncharacterized protein BYT42DRAFT_616776 [Radiomyces spectabilis]|uniref:uncharacterized protein n=1 Tax=Radiomyces spectabilis TaxID=64574 RepID=UPI0022205DF7|nr:uncharacterized protein BYT42DRAFT_616776 [Radiomyces spectabilis]KAI8371708.1 hypothetical protein BYT42DRAFT_616776 [Radiomyces spectabilis]